ncbi:MAG: hypothetical protein HYV07_11690 [Deltaproteobacteria bacterium]|nr:hypothetical protein [Deltaproteobacteria bacterium]
MERANARRFVSVYIFSPLVDHALIIWAPVLFLVVGAAVGLSGLGERTTTFGGHEQPLVVALATAFTLAHIVAVFFRTHGNREIFRLYPFRFGVVPVAVLLGAWVSEAVWVLLAVVIVWMDVWHSSMQTFGFGRIYDKRAGNDALVGRRLDMGMALLTYAGPILAGAALAEHLVRLSWLERVGVSAATDLGIFALRHQPEVARVLVATGTAYTIYYIASYVRLARRGYRVPLQKLLLYVALTFTSIWTWGFDSFGQAYLIMESFHALQYFPMVWTSERKNLRERLGLPSSPRGSTLAFLAFVVPCAAFGVWSAFFATTDAAIAVCFVAEGLHYWYDGFIWSVRRNQV